MVFVFIWQIMSGSMMPSKFLHVFMNGRVFYMSFCLNVIPLYSKTLVSKHNLFCKHACNPKHLYLKANFPIRNNGNSDDSFHNPKYSYKNDYNTVTQNNEENTKYKEKSTN